jgi:hypothetical protein
MNYNGIIGMLLALNTDLGNGKHLYGSMFGNGSVAIICSILGVAILAAIIIFLQKKKKDNKGENDDE